MSWKTSLLNNLPRPLAKSLYMVRNSEVVLKAEALKDVYIELGVPKRNQIWIDRLSMLEGHEVGISRWMQEYVRDGEVFFDIGSCYGYFPALLAQMKKNLDIHAFEGNWMQLCFLKANLPRNVKPENYHLVDQFLGNTGQPGLVAVDDYVQKIGKKPTLIKMDTDGAEFDILKGAQKLIAAKETEWLIEVHPKILTGKGISLQQIYDFFDEDYILRGLIDIRKGNAVWDGDLTKLDMDDNPYIYAGPKSIARF